MNKIQMREWIIDLEERLQIKLLKWRKHLKIEDGEAVQLHWQFEQTHLKIDIFWEDNIELVVMDYASPRVAHVFKWHGLTNKTISKIMDRVGNLAQITMHPVIDPEDR